MELLPLPRHSSKYNASSDGHRGGQPRADGGGQWNKFTPFKELGLFWGFLFRYLFLRLKSVFHLLITCYLLLVTAAKQLKFFAVRRLIWSRGRLGQPVSHLGVLGLASAVFFFGNLMAGTPIVRRTSASSGADFVSSGDVLTSTLAPETILSTGRDRNQPLAYEVKPGDTLTSIGEYFRVSIDAIRYANNLSDEDHISPGEELTIPPVEGVVHEVVAGDGVESLALKYDVPPQSIVEFNYLFAPFELTIGEKLVIPDASIPEPPPPPYIPPYAVSDRVPLYAYDEGGSVGDMGGSTGSFGWPVDGGLISQYFHPWHMGLDLAGHSAVYASDGGRVMRAGWWPQGFGYAVKIDHGNGYTTTYAHLSRIDVSVGQRVGKGQVIGQTGNTGYSFGTHLHFVIQLNGRYLNPLSFL